jgi:hypothetical protein
VYAIDGRATAITAPSSASHPPATRRARMYAGIAASDMTTAFVAFAAPYASTRLSNAAYAGASSAGYSRL